MVVKSDSIPFKPIKAGDRGLILNKQENENYENYKNNNVFAKRLDKAV